MEEYAKYVCRSEHRKRAVYKLANMILHGYVVEHSCEGLYWFNTDERMRGEHRDLLASAEDLKILM